MHAFEQQDGPAGISSAGDEDMKLRSRSSKVTNNDFVDISTIPISSSEDDSQDDRISSTATKRNTRGHRLKRGGRQGRPSRARSISSNLLALPTDEDDSEDTGRRRRGPKRKAIRQPTRRSIRQTILVRDSGEDEGQDDDTSDSSTSDILRSDLGLIRKRKRQSARTSKFEKVHRVGQRQSDRATRATKNMQEADLDDIYRSDSEPKVAAQKISVVREAFEKLPRSNSFRGRHAEGCEVCFDGPDVAPLIYCQGCSFAYHKNCLGNRSNRDHLVTKIGDENFVLQDRKSVV